MIDVRNLSYSIGGRVLLDDVSFYIPTCNLVGVVGANGCGKSTLFSLILGDLALDQGQIIKPSAAKIVNIRQEIRDFSEKLLDFVLRADEALIELRVQSEQEHDGMKLAEIFEEIEKIDGFNAEVRAATILSGLGFTTEDLQKPLKEFSGGWQIRAAIAATLFAPSDILLLDEPTNHLDFETALWLRNYLQKIKSEKTILMVSHDRDFLNVLCDRILHLPSGDLYSGNYDIFLKTRSNQQQALGKRIEKQEATRQHLQSFVDRFRAKASKAKQAQSRMKMLEKMEKLPKLDRDYTVRFQFPNPKSIDRQLIYIKDGVAGYGDNIILRELNLKVDEKDRIALLGANGNGKSTLVKILSGQLPLLNGKIEFAKKIQTAYFSQQLTDGLNLHETPYETLSAILPGVKEHAVRSQLARFGLSQQKSDTLVKDLSGGEKTRLLLAIVTREAPHILILDEPTNHLDIEAKDALVEALNDYQGAIVLVSHDFYIVESVCDQLFLVKNHHCQPFSGDLEDYVSVVLEEKRSVKKKLSDTTDTKKDPTSIKNNRRNKPKMNRLAEVERSIATLTQKKQELEELLITQYSAGNLSNFERVSKELAIQEQEWLKLSSDLG